MKNRFIILLIVVPLLCKSQTHEYLFNNSLNENGSGPPLTEIMSCGATAGSYGVQNTVTTAGDCLSFNSFCFNDGAGVQYSNPGIITGSYTINVFFSFNTLGGWARIIDFSNSTADAGIYFLNNCLNFYPNGNVGTCPYFNTNTFYLITLVRDGSTGIISVYVDGTLFGTYNDSGNVYSSPTSTTPINFFRDDNPVPCETQPGCVKYISVSPVVSTASDVAQTWSNIGTITQSVIATPPTVTITPPGNLTCTSTAVTLTGVSAGNTMVWNGGSLSNSGNPSTVNAVGTYTVTATDANGCKNSASVNVTSNTTPPTITAVSNGNLTCSSGSVTLTGSSAGNTMVWNGGTLSNAANPATVTIAGTYTVTATDPANGCTNTAAVTVTSSGSSSITVTAVSSGNLTCTSTSVTLTGTSAGNTMVWNGGTLNNSPNPATVSAAGTYTVTATDISGCTNTTTVNVTSNTIPPIVTATSSGNLTCSSNSVTITASSAGNTMVWNGGTLNNASNPATVSVAGTYTVTATDPNGCSNSATVAITQTGSGTVTISKTDILCNGGTNGSAIATVTGGVPPYTYNWSNGQTTSTISNLASGNYSVTVTDASCNASGIELVMNGDFSAGNTIFSSSYTYTPPPNGGAGEYWVASGNQVINWNGGMSSNGDHTTGTGNLMLVNGSATANTSVWCQTISVTPNTNYNFSTWVSSLYLTNPAMLQFSINGVALGPVFNAPTTLGNWVQFFSVWNSGANVSANICIVNQNTNPAGNDFALDDISFQACNPCPVTSFVTITQPPPITFTSISSTNELCYHADGTTIVATTGGSGTLTYLWNPSNQATPNAIGLAAGTYSVAVSDANGCTHDTVVTVNFTSGPTAIISPVTPVCEGQSTTLTASGGNSYLWNTTQTTSSINISPTATSSYTVFVTDTNTGCLDTTSVTVTTNPLPTLAKTAINVTCNGACDGQTIVIPNGGTSPYTYSWTGGCTNASCNNLCPGSYTVTVTDAFGCSVTADTTVTEPTAIVASITGRTPTSCNGTCDGTATASASGGTLGAGYSYSWNTIPIQTTATATGLCTGNYICTIIDAHNCTDTVSVNISAPSPVTIAPIANVTICIGSGTTLTASASGGNNGNYSYSWDAPGNIGFASTSSITVSPGSTTTYTVNASEIVNNCPAASIQVTVTVNPPLSVIANGSTSVCLGASASLTALATGGNGGPYTYMWTPATGLNVTTGTNVTATPSNTTTYTITVMDNCGSPAISNTATVTILPLPALVFNVDINEGCAPLCVQLADASTVNGGTIVAWNWDFGDGSTISNSQNPLHCFNSSNQCSVTLTVTSNNGCVSSFTNTNMINVFPKPVADFNPTPNPTDVIDPNVMMNNLSSSDVNYWHWDFGDGTTLSPAADNPIHTYPNTTTGSYTATLIVGNTNGCFDTTSRQIFIGPQFAFYIPNAFSPNGDGKNDSFGGSGVGIGSCDLWIFDRWGNALFHSKNLTDKWDGKANDGALKAQQDVYSWKVDLTDVFGKPHHYIGSVTLVK